MKLRWLLAALLAGVLLVGCQPDRVDPAAGTDAAQPTEPATTEGADETEDARDLYDY